MHGRSRSRLIPGVGGGWLTLQCIYEVPAQSNTLPVNKKKKTTHTHTYPSKSHFVVIAGAPASLGGKHLSSIFLVDVAFFAFVSFSGRRQQWVVSLWFAINNGVDAHTEANGANRLRLYNWQPDGGWRRSTAP